jgi:hypothetical protein
MVKEQQSLDSAVATQKPDDAIAALLAKKKAKRLRILMEEAEERRRHRRYLRNLRHELRGQLRRGEIDLEEMEETYGNAYAHIHSLEND